MKDPVRVFDAVDKNSALKLFDNYIVKLLQFCLKKRELVLNYTRFRINFVVKLQRAYGG